jgi:hypothetical protein
MGENGDVVHVFPPGKRFCIGVGQGRKPAPEADRHDFLRGEDGTVRLLRPGLGNVAVLAPSAGKIAARATQGETVGARHEPVQGFLFDGIDGEGAGTAVGQGIEPAPAAFTAPAEPSAALPDPAVMRAQQALYPILQSLIIPGLLHGFSKIGIPGIISKVHFWRNFVYLYVIR